MTTLRFILGDQLSHQMSSLSDVDKDSDVIFLCEVHEETTYVRHHKKKIAFILSAMRHFAEELREQGFEVRYTRLDDPENQKSFTKELKRAVIATGAGKIVVTEPGEYRVLSAMKDWADELDVVVDIRNDDRFFCSHAQFQDWAEGRKQLRMENFYRVMRRQTGYLMEGDEPIGGQWNFDKDNRESLPDGIALPKPKATRPDVITKEVLALVEERFADHFGTLDGFDLPVTRDQALDLLSHFVDERLPNFGDYQDAMKQGEPTLFHSLIAPALNAGLLNPREVCDKVEAVYREGHAPINAVEGFIRQVLGWREYVRGIYWLKMPEYAATNFLDAKRDLPDFYWTADTKMNCLKQAITETRDNAYAHHIQRLMVTGNFALIYGVEPAQINAWYLAVYADAYEWVQLPNTHGMVMFADGGLLGSKPYAASGAYINKMGDYCLNCPYKVKEKNGETACPFNYLYWNFVMENRGKLKDNQRMRMIFSSLDRMGDDKKDRIRSDSEAFFKSLA